MRVSYVAIALMPGIFFCLYIFSLPYPVVVLLFNIILKFDVHFQIDNCRIENTWVLGQLT